MSLLDKLDRKCIYVDSLIPELKDESRLIVNPEPEEGMNILCPNRNERRLIIVSGNNIPFHSEYDKENAERLWKTLKLIHDKVRMNPAITEMRMIVYDTLYTPYPFRRVPKTTNIAFSFKPDVRTHYHVIKMLNWIRRLFLGEFGSTGFTSPDVYYYPDADDEQAFCFSLTFGFFGGMRKLHTLKNLPNEYQKLKNIFVVCGLDLGDDYAYARLLENNTNRYYNRDSLKIFREVWKKLNTNQ